MTDFTDTWKRASDTVALVTLVRRITQVRSDGRRIWLVPRSPRYDAMRAWLYWPMTLRMTTSR